MRLRPRSAVLAPEGGFTLIELLVATAILLFVVSSIAAAVSSLVTSSAATMNASTLQAQARAALDTLAADARTAYTGDPALAPVASATSTQLTFYAPDRQAQFHLREITYRVASGLLQRASAASSDTDGAPWVGLPFTGSWRWVTVVGSVVANPGGTPVFQYTTDSQGDVSQVTVTLTVDPPGQARASTFTAGATLRTEEPT